MKLTEQQSRVISVAQFQADAPFSLISRQAGVREHTARRIIDSLLEKGVIVPFAVINLYRLGISEFDIYFSLGQETKKKKQIFLNKILSERATCWLQTVSGDFEYALGIAERSPIEATAFLDNISRQFSGNVFINRKVTEVIEYELMRKEFLFKAPVEVETIKVGGEKTRKPEVLDARILSYLANERYRSRQDIARGLDVPLSTLNYRLRSLKEKRVLLGFAFSFKLSSFGIHAYRFLVYSSGMGDSREKFREFCRLHPNIVVCIEAFGDWDFSLKIEVLNLEDVTKIADQIYSTFPKCVSGISIFAIIREHKTLQFPALISSSQ